LDRGEDERVIELIKLFSELKLIDKKETSILRWKVRVN